MATRGSFTHLHTHTEYSMLDGASRLDDLVDAAVADGQPALGITDHGNMYGVLDFYASCRNAGINPVIGTEAYMAGESRHERPVRRGKVDDTGGDVEGGREALLPPDPSGRDDPGIPQPPQAVVGRLPRGLLLQAARSTGSCSSGTTRASSPPPDAWAASCSKRCWPTTRSVRSSSPVASRTSSGATTSSSSSRTTACPSRPRTNPGAGPHRPAARRTAARHQRQPLHPPRGLRGARRAAVRADRCAHRRPQAVQVRGGGALPEVRGGDAGPVLGASRGV